LPGWLKRKKLSQQNAPSFIFIFLI
jgi:hypothetical protein